MGGALSILFSPRGRLNRLGCLAAMAALWALYVGTAFARSWLAERAPDFVVAVSLVTVLVLGSAFVANLMLIGKRLHDLNLSARHALWLVGLILLREFLPSPAHLALGLVCGFLLYLLLFLPGTAGQNRFGPDPRGRSLQGA